MMRTLAVGTALALALAAPVWGQSADSPVRLNQLGVAIDGPKRAMLADPSKVPLDWQLRDAAGQVIARGQTQVFGNDPASGEHVHRIDFSEYAKAAEGVRLVVGDRQSRPFDIARQPLAGLSRDAIAFFYHQRAGVPIEARLVGAWARPAGHPHEVAKCFSGKDERGLTWDGCDYALDVTGGWYDAGDHGKYVVNGGISVWTLQNAYERQKLHGRNAIFADGALAIPEAANGVSDVLDEARYEMEFLLRMQVPQGKRMRVPDGPPKGLGWNAAPADMAEIDASGMAHQKVADRNWTTLPTPPQDDREERLLYPPTTAATLNLAAVAAQAARLWRGIDDPFADRCLAAARLAWAAAVRNPHVYATNSFTGSGGYGDRDVSDEFYWAAAELYATTGERRFREAVMHSAHFTEPVREAGWPNTATLGTITLALVDSDLPPTEVARLRRAIGAAADGFVADSDRVGYQIPYAPQGLPWGSTSSLLNRAMLIGYAADWSPKERGAAYRAAMVDTLDYLLGRNPLDRSFVSGYGARPMRNPHHRFWAHSLDSKLPGPPPGVLSGGPNNTAMGDPVAARLQGKCAPQKCWADDIQAYALNEVAINWNAPLFWVAAWAQ